MLPLLCANCGKALSVSCVVVGNSKVCSNTCASQLTQTRTAIDVGTRQIDTVILRRDPLTIGIAVRGRANGGYINAGDVLAVINDRYHLCVPDNSGEPRLIERLHAALCCTDHLAGSDGFPCYDALKAVLDQQ